MRYLSVLACFLAVAACTFDDGVDANSVSDIAQTGQIINLSTGSANLTIDAAAIGTNTGQIPPGSRVTLTLADSKPDGYALYSPAYKVTVKDDDGNAVTGLNLNPPAIFECSYDKGLAGEDGVSNSTLALLRVNGATITELEFADAPATDTEFTITGTARARASLTNLHTYCVAATKPVPPPPPAVALTGTVSTLASSTIFQLANTAATFDVTMAVRTADTTTPPTVITLNDAAFNAANPLDPNNRLLTVETGGNTYTTDHAAASVVVQLDTFTTSASSGSMLGTMVRQGGSETLAVNFTFTTGGGTATALGGAVIDAGGRRTITLTNAANDETVLILLPDNLPDGSLNPITFNDASFDTGSPLDPAGRLLTVNDGGEVFSSDVPVVGSVTVTFTSFNGTNFTGAGTITGTVVSATPTQKTLNYSFTLVAGSEGGAGALALGTAFDITTTDVADECAAATDGTDYVVVWLSDTGTTNRTLEFVFLDGSTLAPFGAESYEPTVNLNPGGGFAFAANDVADTVVVAADGTSATTANVHAIFYDPVFDSLYSEVNLGTGAFPRVQYHFDQDLYVIAWQSGADVMAAVFENDGTQVGTTQTVFTAATLAGLAAAGDTTDEALITATDGSGVRGRYVTVSTGATSGAAFDVSTALGGGLCVWEDVGGQYLVVTEALAGGFFEFHQAVALGTGDTTITGTALPLPVDGGLAQAAWGSDGAIFVNPQASLITLDSGTTGPAFVAAPIYGELQGGLDIDVTADGPAIASLGATGYVLVSARGAGGVRVQPLTLTP